MPTHVNGLHHVTAIASAPDANNSFFTVVLGLRRVKTTVNFDNPSVYHLYYGDEVGRPGTVITHFPFPDKTRGTKGVGEVSVTRFSVPVGALEYWERRLNSFDVAHINRTRLFGAGMLEFEGPDGDALALVETNDARHPWVGSGVPRDAAIQGFHSVALRLAEVEETAKLLRLMGYQKTVTEGNITRFWIENGNGADFVDLIFDTSAEPAIEGAGSVHHVAFSVETMEEQLALRDHLTEAGFSVTKVRDRSYFLAIYFRSPGGVLFEVATDAPGFVTDEDVVHLGEALKLPPRHEHLRQELEGSLQPL